MKRTLTPVPKDFKKTFVDYKNDNTLSTNRLVKHYKISPSVIVRWLEESNLYIEKQNAPKETLIDFVSFSNDATSGKCTIQDLAKKYNLARSNVLTICKRNNIKHNFKSEKFEPKEREQFLSYLFEHGKVKTAKKYETTLSIISGWCRRNGIVLPKYIGVRNTKIDNKIDEIKNLYEFGYTQSFIAQMYNTSGSKIKRLLIEHGVPVQTKFDIWKEERKIILSNLESFIEQNKNGADLIEIANANNVSYEVLKRTFRDNGIDVILHSYNKSNGEIGVKNFIKSLGFECESVKKKHNGIQYEIDCFVESKNIGVEYCGEYWHSKNGGKPKKYHQDKMTWCAEQNIELMTIFEHEWYTKTDLLKSMIKSRLGICENKIYARKTDCVMINKAEAKLFHDKNHINGGLRTSSIDLGLLHEGSLVSVASFSKSRFSKDAEYEILRFSTLQNHTVVGGFSKIFKHFVDLQNPKNVVSFCDLRFGKGGVYEKTGFANVGTTPPNYWYYFKKDDKMGAFESRIKYQKHKLKHFSNYSDDKTEYEIMDENGYFQIFDCGNYKFIYENGGS